MNTYVNYFIESNLSLCFLFLVYRLLFHHETNFRFKRIYLLMAIGFSLVLPLVEIHNGGPIAAVSSVLPETWLPEVVVTANADTSAGLHLTPWTYAALVYVAGVVLFLSLFTAQLLKLINIVRLSPRYASGKFVVVESDSLPSTFSFFHFIFIGNPGSLSEKEKAHVVRHEEVHANRFHSLDSVLVNLLIILFWFNPLIRLYRKSFVQLHEFEADARAVESHDVNEYCSLLARVALKSADFQVASHFTNSLTIKRINMMRTSKSSIRTWKMVAMTAVIASFFYFITGSQQVIAQSKPQAEASPSDEIYMVVEQAPEYFENGMDGLGPFIANNLRYPKSARQKGLEGIVYVSFVVEKDGQVTNPEVIKGVSQELDEEAVRVVKLTKWIPGQQSGKRVRSKFVMPINYKLN